MLEVKAHAKINLSLEVLGRRSDGFHEIVSVMQTVTLSDTLQVELGPDIALTSSSPQLPRQSNLVFRAARLMQQRFGVDKGCVLDLDKVIPVAAGLGGGSSDAAATLAALTRLWDVPAHCTELKELAADLGSDVPFFLYGGTALIEGRGEKITPLPSPAPARYVLVNPNVRVSTAAIFAALPPTAWRDGSSTRKLAHRIASEGTSSFGVNTLQPTLFALQPAAAVCYERVCDCVGPHRTTISGSGPTVAAMVDTEEEAHCLVAALAPYHYWTYIATSCGNGGWETPCA